MRVESNLTDIAIVAYNRFCELAQDQDVTALDALKVPAAFVVILHQALKEDCTLEMLTELLSKMILSSNTVELAYAPVTSKN